MENKFPISDEELQKLSDWLKSDEGKKKLRESQEAADEACKIIDSMRDIDPELLRIPFGPVGRTWEESMIVTEKCECAVKTNVELRSDGKRYCERCGKLYD